MRAFILLLKDHLSGVILSVHLGRQNVSKNKTRDEKGKKQLSS